MNNAIKKICLGILGLLQGTLGSYLALLGWVFAFPETFCFEKLRQIFFFLYYLGSWDSLDVW